MSNAVIVLETPRLLLRELTEDDAGALAALYADPEVMRFFDRTRTREEAEAEIVRAREWYRLAGYYLWATIEKESGRFIGRCGILPQRIEERDEYEIAWMLVRDCWGRGLATEAASAIKVYGFERFGFARMVSIVAADNVASIRVAEKNEMRYVKDVWCQGYFDRMYAVDRPQVIPGVIARGLGST